MFRILRRWGVNERIWFRYAGARFYLFNTPMTQLMFFDAPRWHGARDLQVLKTLLRAGDTVIDIGANVGSHIIPLAKRLSPATQAHAFEAHPRIFYYLQKNSELNRLYNLNLYPYALDETEGEVHFTDLHTDDLNRIVREPAEAEVLTVPMRPLDSFPCAAHPITLIKLDVEGYELFVLKGATNALENTQLLYIEVCDAHTARYGYRVQDITEFLRLRGWELFHVVGTEPLRLCPVEQAPFVEAWENWLGVRDLDWLQVRGAVEVAHGR